MAMIKKAVKGMKDITPQEMSLRNYVCGLIRETYLSYGFTQIETPCVEHIENLSGKQGGENEKLIFKILKRGNKLDLANAKSEADLCDSGLRYDLTVPLSRYYAEHASELPQPFKALQMGNVFRAEQPQRGRFRQFMQCDIDIFGEASNMAEIELILATTSLLGRLDFKDFNIRINDRRMLKAMASYAGFAESDFDAVFIILDKMDKIGIEGVKSELTESGFDGAAIDKYLKLFEELKTKSASDALDYLTQTLGEEATAPAENLKEIVASVEAAKRGNFAMVFDPTLVRGMSYYTGTIFEAELKEFGSSCAGGGRYDEMVGRFTGQNTPACGFSIGFERIITILMEQGFEVPAAGERVALLVEKGLSPQEAFADAEKLRGEGKQVLVVRMAKNKKFQKENLAAQGYGEIKEYFKKQENA
ncbi:MAG: histidine--tRNA ligase [Lachnospiraceae bacterium]|nr:histidine--tRNA ligase [Lachnospiraceae bacterium]